jgi:Tol biopolymer transport system component
MAQGLMATTTVTVQLQMLVDPSNLAGPLGPIFAAATVPDPQLSLDYPYDKTVFPRGLPSPVMQWCLGVAPACTGNATDIYDIKITGPTATFETFTATSTPAAPSFTLPTMPTDVWRTLTDSTTGAMTFSIARYDGATAYMPVTETWTVAAADLAGTIYYWEINNGTVVKMPLGQAPGTFLQIPTATPAIGCVACHSVSKDGSTVVAAFNGSASPWGTFNTQTGASIYVSGSDPSNGAAGSGFEAIAPDGSLVLWGQEQQVPYLTLSASNSASSLAQLNPGGGNPVQPAWSPDGTHVAFGVRTDGSWLDYTTSTLWIASVTPAPTPGFSALTQIVPNIPTRTTTIYPTFSPDSSWIAFERSTQARSRGAQAELWLTSVNGQTVQSLDAANTGTGLYTQNDANYEPTFMPVAVGGYFWLVFVSERVYGNTLTDIVEGTTAAPGRHKQLWVTAIDAQPQAGIDPSHPAFWLPGQNTADQNMRGEWALDPCLQQGQSCNAGYQCCAGFCRAEDGGTPVCTMPTGGCSASGEACKTAADCCSSTATCIGGFCNMTAQ